MHVFTSITANYLPKAAVLAHSLKRTNPNCTFHLLLSDDLPADCPKETLAAFDHIVSPDMLPIDNLRAWTFGHTVVELCTAVKGAMVEYLFDTVGAERVFYFDPDIAVLGSLEELNQTLSRHSIALTPHQCQPEENIQAIIDNEICSLAHGIYNLGFLAVRNTGQGIRFARWWAERLRLFCHDDKPRGLFTDQRWIDLAPAFFDDIAILRNPGYNVATWNLTHRKAAGEAPWNITVNGQPLTFYHFSGFDSGAQLTMLDRYGKESPVLFDLRDWYLSECEKFGQSLLGKRPSKWAAFENGQVISKDQRVLYRNRKDLQQAFPDPYSTSDISKSYFHWFAANGTRAIARQDKPESQLVQILRRHAHKPPLKWAKNVWKSARAAL